jgi:AcrR family transcriptional regulator
LATAADLFYKHGIHAVGIDRIIRESGAARMTFYKYFPSKSNLVATYLSHKNNLWLDTLTKFTGDPTMTGVDRLLAIFDVLDLVFPISRISRLPVYQSTR